MHPDVCPVVVATAPGKGFENGRWLARWGSNTVLGHVLTEVRSWGLGTGILILGDEAEQIMSNVDCSGYTIILDPEWEGGVVASLRTAFDFLQRESEVETVLFVDAAYPAVPRAVVDDLLAAVADTERPAVVPKYRYATGGPVLLQRWLWPQLVGVDRTSSIAGALETHRDWIHEVWFDRLPPAEIDTPDALVAAAPRR